ncbi:MAG: right-handed parallel beta-helix repeat-containing protein, partial [Desulfobacterales bacterium]|nr:right-handed parallel beta-helix repeat-containing protein [Desulfobacterales bacterium]
DSETPLIEQNLIINCDRGIGLGLGTRGCSGGLIRNNMIYSDHLGLNSDVGIGLESTQNARVYNNTIYLNNSYTWAIEFRWAASTGNLIVNNLTNKSIAGRDSGSATVRNNVTDAAAGWFLNPASGDLHLAQAVNAVVDAGETLDDVPDDVDGEPRPIGSGYDIGADEYGF